MGELIKFELENNKNNKIITNIFIPQKCSWNNLNDLIKLRFNLNNNEIIINEIIIKNINNNEIIGNINSNNNKNNNIIIPSNSYCVVYLNDNNNNNNTQNIPASPIPTINKKKNNNNNNDNNVNDSNNQQKNQLPNHMISPINKIPISPITMASPISNNTHNNNNNSTIIQSIQASPIQATSLTFSNDSISPIRVNNNNKIVSNGNKNKNTNQNNKVYEDNSDEDKDDPGNTIFHESCKFGFLQSVITMVNDGQYLEILNNYKQTPFLLACLNGHLEVAQYLAKSGANVFAEDENWNSAIHYAAKCGNINLIDWLITEIKHNHSIVNKKGQTPEDIAKLYHQEDAISYFELFNNTKFNSESFIPKSEVYTNYDEDENENEGEDYDYDQEDDDQEDENNNNENNNNEDEINHNNNYDNEDNEDESNDEEEEDKEEQNYRTYFSDKSQSISQSTSRSLTKTKQTEKLTKSTNEESKISSEPIYQLNESEKLFLDACLNNDKEFIIEFLENGGNINCCNENGSQGIHFIASTGNLELIILLLEYGIDIDVLNNNKCSALHFACQNSHIELVKWLITEGGSNVFIENINGLTPIHVLCGSQNSYDGIYWFIETQSSLMEEFYLQATLIKNDDNDADDNNDNDEDNNDNLPKHSSKKLTSRTTLLHVACASDNVQIVSLLLPYFDISIKDEKYHNCLHIVCNEQNLEILKVLCSYTNPLNLSNIINITTNDTNITPVFYACLNGSYDIVKYLVKLGADLTICNVRGNSCLHVACQNGNLKLVKYLLKKNCSLQVVNNSGFWPLDFAIKSQNNELISYLRDIYAISSNLYQELANLCFSNNLSGLKTWINDGYDIITCLTVLGYEDNMTLENEGVMISLLHEISRRGCYEIFLYLSKLPHFILDVKDKYNRTPLHMVCMNSSSSAISLLELIISFDIFLDVVDSFGYTPFFYACQYNNLIAAQKLVNLGCNIYHNGGIHDSLTTALHLATAYGHLNIVKWLVESGLNINALNENENTPIDISKFEGFQDIYHWYISEGINLHEKRLESTLLHQIVWALDNNYFLFASSVLKEILSIIDEPNKFISPIDGSNLLHYSCACGNLEQTKFILSSYKCDILAENNSGYTPFHLACLKNHEILLEFLRITCNVKITIKDHLGNTGLHYACMLGHLKIVNYYCHYGLINMLNNNDFHSLHYACQNGFLDIVQILVEHNVNLNILTNDNMTPLHLACYFQWDEIIVYLIKTKKCNLELEDNNHMTPINLINLIKNDTLSDWIKIITSGIEIYPNYEPSTHFKNRGKKLRLPTEIYSESESEDNQHSQHSKSDGYDHHFNNSSNINNGTLNSNLTPNSSFTTIFSPSSLFFCISDTSSPTYSSSLSDNNNYNNNNKGKKNQLNSSKHRKVGQQQSSINNSSHHNSMRQLAKQSLHNDENEDNSDNDDDHNNNSHNNHNHNQSNKDHNDNNNNGNIEENDNEDNNNNNTNDDNVNPKNSYKNIDPELFSYVHKILFESVENNNFELFKEIFEENLNIIDIGHQNPLTLNNIFHLCVKSNNLSILRYLVNQISDVNELESYINIKNINSSTPLHIACEEGYNDIILFLMTDCEANLNIGNNKQQTPFIILIESKNIIILKEIESIVTNYSPNNPIQIDLQYVTNTNQTYFYFAVQTKNYDVIKIIINIFKLQKSSINGGNSQLLLEYINKPELTNNNIPLHYACLNCSYNIIQLLLQNGSDVTFYDASQNTAVYYAVISGNIKIIQLLLEKYDNINCINTNGDSLLHVACQYGRLIVAKWFVSKGLNMKLKNNNGITPIKYSEDCGNKGLIEWSKTFL